MLEQEILVVRGSEMVEECERVPLNPVKFHLFQHYSIRIAIKKEGKKEKKKKSFINIDLNNLTILLKSDEYYVLKIILLSSFYLCKYAVFVLKRRSFLNMKLKNIT